MTETITPKLAKAVSIAGMTPGLRMISASGALDLRSDVASSGAISSAIFFVSGRTNETIAAVTRLIAGRCEPGDREVVRAHVLALRRAG